MTYATSSSSIFTWIKTIISNFAIFFIFKIFLPFGCLTFHIVPAICLLITLFVKKVLFFLKMIIYLARFFKHSQNVFIKSLPLHTSCLLFISLNCSSVDFEKLMEYVQLLSTYLIFQDYFYGYQIFLLKIPDLYK